VHGLGVTRGSGETQTMSFPPNAPPPFDACDAPRSDVMGRKVQDKRTKRPPQEAGGGGSVGPGLEMSVIREGYAGKAKGRKQVLWERGWFLERMSTTATVAPEMNIDTVLGNLPDFKNERPALQHLVESRGHILLLSPKFHPELAGVGIEYSWGMSKQKFRREINDEVPKHLHRNMVASMCTDTILTVQRVRRFARRTRDYCRAYLALEKGGDIESKDMIEKMKKICKAHRNILDMEPGFIDKQ